MDRPLLLLPLPPLSFSLFHSWKLTILSVNIHCWHKKSLFFETVIAEQTKKPFVLVMGQWESAPTRWLVAVRDTAAMITCKPRCCCRLGRHLASFVCRLTFGLQHCTQAFNQNNSEIESSKVHKIASRTVSMVMDGSHSRTSIGQHHTGHSTHTQPTIYILATMNGVELITLQKY